jgi:hypothetical protein
MSPDMSPPFGEGTLEAGMIYRLVGGRDFPSSSVLLAVVLRLGLDAATRIGVRSSG